MKIKAKKILHIPTPLDQGCAECFGFEQNVILYESSLMAQKKIAKDGTSAKRYIFRIL